MKTFIEIFEYQPEEEEYNSHDQSFGKTSESFCSIGYYNVNKIDIIHRFIKVWKDEKYRLVTLSKDCHSSDLYIKEEDAKLLTK